MSRFSRLLPLLLALSLLLLSSCGRIAGAGEQAANPNAADPDPSLGEEAVDHDGPLLTEPPTSSEPGAAPESSEALPIEQRSEAYGPLLEGCWTTSDGTAVWTFQLDGTGTVSWLEEEELQSFDWSVLRDESGMDILYLFFDGSDAASRYLPVFDEEALSLCDPESLEPLMTLTDTAAEG